MIHLDRDAQRVPRRIIRMLAAMGLCAIAAIVALSLWMTRTVDDIAAENARKLVSVSLTGSMENLQTITWDYADWQAAYDWVTERADEEVNLNIGTGATESDAFDRIFIHEADGTPLYAFASDGNASDLGLIDRAFSDPYVEALREIAVGEYPMISGYVDFGGTPGMVAATRVLPYEPEELDPAGLPIMITVKLLTPDAVTALGEKLLLDQMAIVSDTAALPAQIVLRDQNEQTVAALAWQPASPGREMLSRTINVIAILSVLLFVGSIAVGQVSAGQTRAFLHEHMQARTDALTGLLNRTGLSEAVISKASEAGFAAGHAAVIYLDINKFKQLNDELGHETGDFALRKMAERLQFTIRKHDVVARLGGDEFIVILHDEEPKFAAQTVIDRLVDQAKTPLQLPSGGQVLLQASIGVAFAEPGLEWRTLLMRADAAMYQSKGSESGLPVVYDRSADAFKSSAALVSV